MVSDALWLLARILLLCAFDQTVFCAGGDGSLLFPSARHGAAISRRMHFGRIFHVPVFARAAWRCIFACRVYCGRGAGIRSGCLSTAHRRHQNKRQRAQSQQTQRVGLDAEGVHRFLVPSVEAIPDLPDYESRSGRRSDYCKFQNGQDCDHVGAVPTVHAIVS
jgi:hypothetical protein